MNYTPNEPVIRSGELASAEMQGETVMMSIEEQSYFGLRATSQRIWKMLEQPCTLDQIVATLLSEYEVDRPQCEREVAAFMHRLWEARLIVPASGATH